MLPCGVPALWLAEVGVGGLQELSTETFIAHALARLARCVRESKQASHFLLPKVLEVMLGDVDGGLV